MNKEVFFHILVVDDDERLRKLLKKYLSEHGYFITTAKNTEEALMNINDFLFDIMILDVMMPGENGLDFLRKIRINSEIPVIMLTAMGEAEDRIQGLEIGADDYLVKPFEPRELILRIQKILRKKPQKSEQIARFGNIIFYPLIGKLLDKNNMAINLTSSELNLLKILYENAGNVISREKLAEASGGVNERTIDVQITRLRGKIEPEHKYPIYLKTIRGEGYILYYD